MRADFKPLDLPATAPNDGDDIECSVYKNKTVQIIGAFTGSIDIEVSLDNGGHYAKSQTGITAPGVYDVPHTCTNIRLHLSALTVGTPSAYLGGLHTRTDV
jgi:hypothetical protein